MTDQPALPAYLTLPELARLARMSDATLRQRIRRKTLKAEKRYGSGVGFWVVPRAEAERLLEERRERLTLSTGTTAP